MASYDVREYGAAGNGATVDTDSIQATIDACADEGGGRVSVLSGEYVTAPLFLRSDVELHLEAGATLLWREEFGDYPAIDGRSGGAVVGGAQARRRTFRGTRS